MEEYKGLTSKEAQKLLIQYGENAIRSGQKMGVLKIFAGQFKDAMIMILLAATLISALMGDVAEAITIISIVFLNAILGFIQEFRTERTLEKLGEMAAPLSTVMRDGKLQSISSRELVPQDIVLLKAGDRVPADGTVLQSINMMCDEAMLSGESENVEKQVAAAGAALLQNNKIFMGTLVTKGKATCVITATGESTEMGGIANMLGEIEVQQTPLQKKLAQLSKYIGIGCLLICFVVAATGILRGENSLDMLLMGISLSVAAVPEGLPAIVTIALALSVSRMVKRNALVRRLHAVETLGCANVICSDKTGTLTENRMTVKNICTYDYQVNITGGSYEPYGDFTINGRQASVMNSQAISMIMNIAVNCNNASVRPKKPSIKGLIGRGEGAVLDVFGEPTEVALLVMAAKANIYKEKSSFVLEAENPFDSSRKMMSVAVRDKTGQRWLYAKGGADIMLNCCTYCLTKDGVQPMTHAMRSKITQYSNEMAENALRVLGFAYRNAPLSGDMKESGMVFAGLTGLLDPPRKEAFAAVTTCRKAHIKPVMITGDYPATAKAIAKDLKIFLEGDRLVTGKELDALSDEQLEKMLPDVSVFARVTPAHKLRIVRSLKKQGNIVAMTGDGVNDAPAIKEADIGVSMGVTGSDVTKEASSVILLDDNFATLVAAVEEGRVIYQNIRKFIRYLLSCNIGEVVTMFFAMLMGMPLPLLPIQILLINLVTDGLPAICLGLEPAEKNVMSKKPRRANESIFSDGLATTIIIRGLLIGLTTLGVFVSLYKSTASEEIARTGALLTLVATQLIHVFECKSETKSFFSINPFNNIKLVLAVAVSAVMMYFTIYNPWMGKLFVTVPLSSDQLLTVLSYCAVVPVVSAIMLKFKNITKRKGDK